MLELELSLIGEPVPTLSRLLATYEAEHHVHLHLRYMDWNKAWPELLTCALYDRGPDVSHIGSTWAGSLIGMNALRPFSRMEIRPLGGAEAYLPQSWQSGLGRSLPATPDQPGLWAVPWTSYTFVLCYRRDLLQRAGIPEGGAFANASALAQTLARLKAAGVEVPWVVPVDPAHVDTLHYVASWVWGANGDFTSPDGRTMLFTQPAALEGLLDYFNLLPPLRTIAAPLNEDAALEWFASGQAAVTIAGSGMAYAWLRGQTAAPEVLANLGVVPMPGVPWIGGDNLVIWKHTQAFPDRERAALALVNYLASLPVQQTLCQGEDVLLPTRPEAFAALPLPETPVTHAIIQSLKSGRAYRPIAMWGRIESQLGQTLGQIGVDICAGTEPEAAIHRYLDPLARRLDITLST